MLAGLKSHQLYEPALLDEIYAFIKPHIETAKHITKEVHKSLIADSKILKEMRHGYGYLKRMNNINYYQLCYNRCIYRIIRKNDALMNDYHICKFIISYLHNQTNDIYLTLRVGGGYKIKVSKKAKNLKFE